MSVNIILASSSVYRKTLLSRLQLPFTCISPEINETPLPDETPEQTAMRLAREKAITVSKIQSNAIIIASDQVATTDNQQIGKPGNHANALRQLQFMRGKEIIFHTALCVLDNRNTPSEEYMVQHCNVQTFVKMRNLSDTELDHYLRIEQPYDCAGSAKNEGLGIAIIEHINSNDPTALTGLPLITVTTMLRNLGIAFFQEDNQ